MVNVSEYALGKSSRADGSRKMSSNAMRWKVTLKMLLIGYKFSGKRNILSSGRKLLK